MKAFVTICILAISSCLVFAEQLSQATLNQIGYAQANYQVCQRLSEQIDDPVMAYYYADMLFEEQKRVKSYSSEQQKVIIAEQDKAMLLLNKIPTASVQQLCASRFDSTSRQYYQQKLKNINKDAN